MSSRLLFYISGHGFGHAARDLEVINAVTTRRPDVHVTLRTAVPEWFLRESLAIDAPVLPGDVDTGMVQPDGITLDEDATASTAAHFYATFNDRVTQEARVIRATGANLVVGDIPPLASAAAHEAGVPSVALGNFTWDWIYQAYPQFDTLAPDVISRIADAYATTTLALRLPFWGGFASMPRVDPVPLIARRATTAPAETRTRLALVDDALLVLASFGGHGGQIALAPAAAAFTVLTVGDDTARQPDGPGNLRVVSSASLRRLGLSYTDLIAASDLVVSKLGYGIVADCLANQVPLLYTLRGRFPEQEVFLRELPHVLRCRYIEPRRLREGDWTDDIAALLTQPAPPHSMATDGADAVAARLLAMAAG